MHDNKFFCKLDYHMLRTYEIFIYQHTVNPWQSFQT